MEGGELSVEPLAPVVFVYRVGEGEVYPIIAQFEGFSDGLPV